MASTIPTPPDVQMVVEVCERLGYGRVMQIAQQRWAASDKVGAFTIGACLGSLVPCGCEESYVACDWCMGTRTLTRKVKTLKDSIN